MTCCGQGRTSLARATLPPSRPAPAQQPAVPPRVAPEAAKGSVVEPLGAAAYAPHPVVTLRYLERSPIAVRGPATGRYYEFSAAAPVKPVDPRDAAALLRTRFFQQVR
jgi:hypothetical protein